MRKSILTCINTIIFASLLSSCASNITYHLPEFFDKEYLNYKTSVKPIDLMADNYCPATRALHVIGKDMRNNPYTVYSNAGVAYTITPSDYTIMVAEYMEDKLRESNLQVNEITGDEIHIWMEAVHADGTFTFGCDVQLRISIPDINYTNIYIGHEGGPIIMNAIGYATNLAINNFLEDPVVQKYLKCQND